MFDGEFYKQLSCIDMGTVFATINPTLKFDILRSTSMIFVRLNGGRFIVDGDSNRHEIQRLGDSIFRYIN